MTLIQTIAKKTKYSVSHIYRVLNGERHNEQIVKVAAQVKKEMKEKAKAEAAKRKAATAKKSTTSASKKSVTVKKRK